MHNFSPVNFFQGMAKSTYSQINFCCHYSFDEKVKAIKFFMLVHKLLIPIFLGNKFALFTECVDKKRTLKKFSLAHNSQ